MGRQEVRPEIKKGQVWRCKKDGNLIMIIHRKGSTDYWNTAKIEGTRYSHSVKSQTLWRYYELMEVESL